MSLNLESFGLKEDALYRGSDVQVKHKDKEDWFPLLRTTKKTLFYKEGEQERKMTLKKLEAVEGDGNQGEAAVREQRQPEKTELALGLLTNTNYEGSGVEVEHVDKEGRFPLIATSNKMVWYKEDGNKRKMTIGKLAGVTFPEGEESGEEGGKEEAVGGKVVEDPDSEFRFDGFFDNDFAMASDPSLVRDNDSAFD